MDDLNALRAEIEAWLDAAQSVADIYALRHTLALMDVADEAEENVSIAQDHHDAMVRLVRECRFDERYSVTVRQSRVEQLRAEADRIEAEDDEADAGRGLTAARVRLACAVYAVRAAMDAQHPTALHCALSMGEALA